MSKTIETNVFGITVFLDDPGTDGVAAGRIVSELRDGSDDPNVRYIAAVDALESLILAHACAGVDIVSPAYLEGVEAAVEAINNHYL